MDAAAEPSSNDSSFLSNDCPAADSFTSSDKSFSLATFSSSSIAAADKDRLRDDVLEAQMLVSELEPRL
jgi:hypothetical protein